MIPNGNAALIVAHPGHELRVYGWMVSARPLLFVLTDGSGSGAEARIESTTRIARETRSLVGSVYGPMSDREIYAAILDHDHHVFTRIVDDLADALIENEIDYVVGDAIEGYNPSHDVCRLMINAAVRMASWRGGALIPNYDFLLMGAHVRPRESLDAISLDLDDAGLERKLAAARSYLELRVELDRAIERFGVDGFRTECLRSVDAELPFLWSDAQVPYYETYGEQRVREGVYDRVLRLREHIMPLAGALWSHSAQPA